MQIEEKRIQNMRDAAERFRGVNISLTFDEMFQSGIYALSEYSIQRNGGRK